MALSDRAKSAVECTYVIVVTFHPDLLVLGRQFSELARQGMNVVVVDNCSPTQSEVAELVSEYAFYFVPLAENRGVAGAHNAGIEHVRQKNGKYLVLLDQDSIPHQRAFTALIEAYLSFPDESKIAAVGSSYTLQSGARGSSFVRFRWFRFKKIFCDGTSDRLHEVDFLISSGTFFPCAVIDAVGPMKEELFIDHVDTEWFLRAKSLGYRSYGSCAAKMSHALGERTLRIWLGRWRTVPVHKGFRYFFMFRNSLWLYRRAYAPGQWVSADLVRLVQIFLFAGILVSPRRQNMKWIFEGVREGFKSTSGWRTDDVVKQVERASQD